MLPVQSIVERISSLESCSTEFEFPAGGNVPIPLESESELLSLLRRETWLTAEDLLTARENLSPNECYACVIFAVRMGILATRTRMAEVLRIGLRGLLFDAGHVDYRDLLGALSILELCSQLVGLDYRLEMANLVDKLEDRTRATVEGYFDRPQHMRNVEVMGFVAEDGDEGIRIRAVGC